MRWFTDGLVLVSVGLVLLIVDLRVGGVLVWFGLVVLVDAAVHVLPVGERRRSG